MALDKRQALRDALAGVRSEVGRSRYSVATKYGDAGSGGSEGSMDKKDEDPHEDLEGDSMDEVQDYESNKLNAGRSAHLDSPNKPPSESSRMQENDADEGDDDYPGSMEAEGESSDDSSDAMETDDYNPNRNAPDPDKRSKTIRGGMGRNQP
jgi:hypothetical protein